MKSPITGKEMSLLKEKRIILFRGKPYKIDFHFYKCEDTQEQFEDEILAELNYNQVINQIK